MKTEYLEEGTWVYMLHPGHYERKEYTFARIARRNKEKPFSKENSSVVVPNYGQTSYNPEDIILVFPRVGFKPIHVLIDKIARENNGEDI